MEETLEKTMLRTRVRVFRKTGSSLVRTEYFLEPGNQVSLGVVERFDYNHQKVDARSFMKGNEIFYILTQELELEYDQRVRRTYNCRVSP